MRHKLASLLNLDIRAKKTSEVSFNLFYQSKTSPNLCLFETPDVHWNDSDMVLLKIPWYNT